MRPIAQPYMHLSSFAGLLSDMYLLYPCDLLLLSLLISLPLILLAYGRKRKSSRAKSPPGQSGWPIVGETLAFVVAGKKGCPEKFTNDRVSKHLSEVFRTSLFGYNFVVFCGASGNKFLFSGYNKYVTPWWPRSVKQVLFFPETQKSVAEDAIETRQFLPEILKPDGLRKYVGIMDSMARQHIERYCSPEKQVVKVVPLSKSYTFGLACKIFMGITHPEHVATLANPFSLVTAGLISVPINFPGTAFSRAMKGGKAVREEVLRIIEQRKRELSGTSANIKEHAAGAMDFLTHVILTTKENGESMSGKEIANKITGLLFASYETTSTALTFVLNYLAEYPHVYTKVLQGESLNLDDITKMKYSWCVVCEAMRLSPPSQGAFREAITDFTYAGFNIPKGWKVYWTVYSTHKNPKYFSDPEKFDPSRFEGNGPAPYSFVPFGGGPRMCPGKEHARLEILVFVHNLVTKFKWEKVIPNEKIVYNPSPVPESGLPVRLQPHTLQAVAST